jgi:hypothetical protein
MSSFTQPIRARIGNDCDQTGGWLTSKRLRAHARFLRSACGRSSCGTSRLRVSTLAADRVREAAGSRHLPLYPPQASMVFVPLAHLWYGWAVFHAPVDTNTIAPARASAPNAVAASGCACCEVGQPYSPSNPSPIGSSRIEMTALREIAAPSAIRDAKHLHR